MSASEKAEAIPGTSTIQVQGTDDLLNDKGTDSTHSLHETEEALFLRYTEHYRSRGVKRMEKVKLLMDKTRRGYILRIVFCVAFVVSEFLIALDSSTTSSYQPYATSSLGHHSMLSTVDIATAIIPSIAQLLIAKTADITTRPITYTIIMMFYVLGFIINASTDSISTYVVGTVFQTIGSTGVDLINTIILADIIPLKNRGFLLGLSSFPYVLTVWIGGYIADHFIQVNWRWGYGMFAILVPAVITPCIASLWYVEHYAQTVAVEEGLVEPDIKFKLTTRQWVKFTWNQLVEMDFFALIVMAFGWALLLLPFSLYSSAEGQYSNPSLIAMFVVGSILLIAYAVFEIFFSPFPSLPKRVLLNRTFVVAVVIDFFYMFGEGLYLEYLPSYTGVIKNWSIRDWNYFNNTLTLSICFFAFPAGLIFKYTHRTKFWQSLGLLIQVVGMAVGLHARGGNANNSALVWPQMLLGLGGAFSNIGTQIASQACVPHQDVALVIALLLQWSTIGYAIGYAIGGALWQSKLPVDMRKYLPSSVNDTMIDDLFNDYTLIQAYDMGTPIREGSKTAYTHVFYYLCAPALGVTVIAFVVSFFQKNYYLGDSLNGVETDDQNTPPSNALEKFLIWFDNPWTYRKNIQKCEEYAREKAARELEQNESLELKEADRIVEESN